MIRIFLILILLMFQGSLYSQSIAVGGVVIDAQTREPVKNASVCLINPADSLIIKFTRSDANGKFRFKWQNDKPFFLMVTYPLYADIIEMFNPGLLTDSVFYIGSLKISSEIHVLEEVIVKQKVNAIRIKGDTTEFAADSFYVKPNENVEELLKKLPGFKIDKDGKITVQGSRVKRVLVDGEEFFGDDPTLVTQNLRADMVEKVQVFDKKSDQAVFSGIDDGKKDKTVNIRLKKNLNMGYFGKVDAGTGGSFSKVQAMLNSFSERHKKAIFFTAGNTGTVGLGNQDQGKYGFGGESGTIGDDGIYYVTKNASDGLDTWDGKFDGKGLPDVVSGGIHYDVKLPNDRLKSNFNYKYGSLNTRGERNSILQYGFPGGSFLTRLREASRNSLIKNTVSISSEYQIDSLSSLKITGQGMVAQKSSANTYHSESTDAGSNLLNVADRTFTTGSDDQTFNANMLYRKKFNKVRRTLSLSMSENYNQTKANGYLYSLNKYSTAAGPLDSVSVIIQRKNYLSTSLTLNTRLTYTEPLGKNSTFSFGVQVYYNSEKNRVNSFNIDSLVGSGKIDSSGSNDYRYYQFVKRVGGAYNYKYKKVRFQAGNDFGFIDFDQQLSDQTIDNRRYRALYPQSSITYSFSTQKNLTLSYSGHTQLPGIEQLQPVVVNIDPLNIIKGNTDLQPSFDHLFSGLYIHYKEPTGETFFLNAGYHFVNNPVAQVARINYEGAAAYTFRNLNGNDKLRDVTGRGLYRKIFKQTPYAIDLNLSFMDLINTSVINTVPNEMRSVIYAFNPVVYFSKEKKIDMDMGAVVQYNRFHSAIASGLDNIFWSYNLTSSVSSDFISKFRIQTDINFNLKTKTAAFGEDINYTVWNIAIRRSLLNGKLFLRMAVNDLLNQNLSNERFVLSNLVIQNSYISIRRYFMVSAIWNFKQEKKNVLQGK